MKTGIEPKTSKSWGNRSLHQTPTTQQVQELTQDVGTQRIRSAWWVGIESTTFCSKWNQLHDAQSLILIDGKIANVAARIKNHS